MTDQEADAYIAAGFVVQEGIRGKGRLRIDGVVEGGVQVEGDVHVGSGARVEGDIVAERVILRGAVEGSTHARGHVELMAGCRTRGEVRGASVKAHDGAETLGGVRPLDDPSFAARSSVSSPAAPRSLHVPSHAAHAASVRRSSAPLAPRLGRRQGRWRSRVS